MARNIRRLIEITLASAGMRWPDAAGLAIEKLVFPELI
jgi:hypothetical protein